jgi:uncharacterized protein
VTYQSLRLPLLVLDTNVVLDWLVFNNPSSRAFTQAIESGGVRWIVNDALRDELAHVLARGVVARWQPDIDALWRTWNHLSTASNLLPATGAPGRPRCTDTDDQKFIDLALDVGASWLLSRDRAVLKLARSAHQLGLRILKPEQFAAAVMPG